MLCHRCHSHFFRIDSSSRLSGLVCALISTCGQSSWLQLLAHTRGPSPKDVTVLFTCTRYSILTLQEPSSLPLVLLLAQRSLRFQERGTVATSFPHLRNNQNKIYFCTPSKASFEHVRFTLAKGALWQNLVPSVWPIPANLTLGPWKLQMSGGSANSPDVTPASICSRGRTVRLYMYLTATPTPLFASTTL